MIIEIDGGQHSEQREKDQLRTQCLKQFGGYQVVRF